MLSLINFVSSNLMFVFFLGHGWFTEEEYGWEVLLLVDLVVPRS